MTSFVKVIAVVTFVLALAGLATLTYVGVQDPTGYAGLGPWGDFFGGVANPILTFLTFIAVLITLWLQHEELGLSRQELARSANALEAQIEGSSRQRKENTFFQMMSIHNEIVNAIDLSSGSKPTSYGRDCFSVFYTRLAHEYREVLFRDGLSQEERINIAFKLFWEKHQTELSHYYRFLYRFVLFTDREFTDDDFYMSLLRAQLSDQELLLLFYNAQYRDGSSFKKLIEKWALLDNMPRSRLFEGEHEQLLLEPAYDSDAAREFRREID